MAKVKKFAMGGMNLNRSSRRPPPTKRPSPQVLPAKPFMGRFNSPAGQPVAAPVQVPNTSGVPAGLAAMGGGLSESQLSGLRNNLGPQSAPANAVAEINNLRTGMGARPSSVGGFSSPAGQPVQVPNTSGAPAGLGAMGGMKKGGSVKQKASSKTYKFGGSVSSASKRGDGIAQRGKTRGKLM